jgi:hypothetical protein
MKAADDIFYGGKYSSTIVRLQAEEAKLAFANSTKPDWFVYNDEPRYAQESYYSLLISKLIQSDNGDNDTFLVGWVGGFRVTL